MYLAVQSKTAVPIPKILDWSDDPFNDIGSEYIISEHAAGVQLHQRWPMMSGEQQIVCIQAISMNIQQMGAIDFSAYGSLYFADAPLDPSQYISLDHGFCIGPHCGTRYWDCNVGETRYYGSVKPNRGPCGFLVPIQRRKSADCPGQGLTLPHIAMDSSMLESPNYQWMIRTSRQDQPSMDLLRHIPACCKSVVKSSEACPRIREFGERLPLFYFMPI